MTTTVSIMQPTYLPWLGYFDLIDCSDVFVLLDTVQFERRSWQQRNRIKTADGLLYMTVPTLKKGRYDQPIKDVEIVPSSEFPNKHIRTIEHHYRRTPYFQKYFPELEHLLKSPESSLATLNLQLIQWLARQFGITTPIRTSSTMKACGKRAELLAELCIELGCGRYISTIGASDYLIEEHGAFERRGIKLEFQNYEHPSYRQINGPFIPYASGIDLLFNEGERSLEIIRSGRRANLQLAEVVALSQRLGGITSKQDFRLPAGVLSRSTDQTLIIRTGCSVQIGTGHVMRCLTLAEAWRKSGGTVVFAMASTTTAISSKLREKGFDCLAITAIPGTAEGALQLTTLARHLNAQWVVADGYEFGADFQKQIKDAGLSMVAFDDYGHAGHYYADYVLNQNLSADARFYEHREPHTKLLLGTRFALLREEFLPYRNWKREIPAVARKVLVTLGGADPDNVTLRVIEALRGLDVEAKIVVGGANPHSETLKAAAGNSINCALLFDVPNMSELMAWADLSICAGGSTCWEMCLLGLPMIAISIAANQDRNVRGLAAVGAAVDAGDLAGFKPDGIARMIATTLQDQYLRQSLSRSSRCLVDGGGAERVVKAMTSSLAGSDGSRLSKIAILCSDPHHPVMAHLLAWRDAKRLDYEIDIFHRRSELAGGDILFLISCSELIGPEIRRQFKHTLVIHASDLPRGRGWSPHIWQIIEGKNDVTVSMIEAADAVDAGPVWRQESVHLEGHELWDEINTEIFDAELRLMDWALENVHIGTPTEQPPYESSYYRKRAPADSRIAPEKSIAGQFDLLRACDPVRFPAFFELRGKKYAIQLRKID